jgi:hypothetical protein
MIGDEQIKELRKKKPALQEAQLRALGVAFDNFKASPRFEMLRLLPLSQFLKNPPTGLKTLKSRPLADLVEAGVFKLCQEDKLNNTAVKKLAEVFFRLQGNPGSEPPPPKAKVFSLPHLRAVSDRPSANPPVMMGSVEAEEKLESAFKKLKLSPRFPDICENRLADFWDRSHVAAPFEESLTFRQISEMKVRALLEKKSFGAAKINGILAAIEKAIGSPVTSSTTTSAASSATHAKPATPAVASSILWNTADRTFPKTALMLLRQYEYQTARASESVGPLARLLREIPQKILAHEFLAMWFLQEFQEEMVARLLGVDRSEVLTMSDIAYKKLDRLISASASELRSYWEIALRGPGIGSEKLIEIFREPVLDDDFQIGICQVLLSSTGARHPIIFGEDLSQYWSKSPSALQMSVTSLISSLPKSDQAVQEEIDALFPFFEKSVIVSILKRQAFFRERDKVWVRRGGDVA